jgi:autotransporter adhesin
MMNKIYKVVFNQTLQVFQVVSEFAKGHSKAETPKALKKNMSPLSAKTWTAVLAAVGILSGGFVFAADTAAVTVSNGTNTTATSTVDATDGYTDYKVNLNDNIVLDSVTTGSTIMNANGVTVGGVNGVSLTSAGLNNGGNAITNVEAGTNGTDAVNVNQMNTAAAASKNTVSNGTNTTVSSSTAADGHTNYQVNLSGAISLSSVTTGNTVMNTNGVTIGSGSTAVSLTSVGLNNGGNTITNVKAGTNGTDVVNVSQMNAATAGSKTTVSNGTNTTVSSSTAADGHTNYQVNLNDAISLGSVTTGNTVMNTNGVTIGSGSTAVSLTSTGLNNGGNKITNVAAGTADTDAVNKGQMTNAIDESMKYFKANSTGTEASATGSDAVAVGSGAVSGGSEAVALGLNTAADGDQSLALGVNAGTSSGTTGAIAVGNTAKASQNGAVAIGQNSAANGKRSTVVGDSAQAVGDQALALGASASASGTNGTALGTSASTAGSSATAVGSHASAAGGSAAAIGDSASASGGDSVALGASSQASGTNDISLGASAGVGTQSGSTSKTQQNRISIGANAGQNGSGNENTAIGLNAGDNVSGNFNVAMGSSAGGATSGDDNTAIGYEANKNGSGSHSTAVGASTTASSAATALGYKAAAVGNNSVAVGYAAQANGSSGVAVGDGAKAADNSIALGHNSAASRSDSSGNAYLTGQAAGIYGVVSVGSSEGDITFQRRIINVADGSNGTDAVNVNQLKAAQTSVATLIGGGVTLNTDGSYGQFSLTDKNGTVHSYDTLAAALGAVTSDQIQVATADAVTYTDGNKTNINANGTISKVTAATSSDQAVNLGQMNSAIAASQTKYYSVNSNESGNQNNTGATGENAIAAGPAATAVGDRSISIGDNTKAQGTNSIAIGNSNTTSDRQATAYGQSSIAIGSSASSAGNNSIALGNYALTEVQNSTSTTVNSAIAIGDQAQATSDQAVALGKNAHASGVNAFAQGNTSSATNESSIAVGTNASSSGTASTVIGKNSAVSGTHSGLIGTSMSTDTNQTGQALTGSDTYVVGNGNGTVGGTNSSIMGNSNTVGTTVTDPNGITHSYNTVNTSILGNSNTVTAQDADVIGHDNTVGKKNLNAAGIADGTIDTAAGSGVFGGNNTVYGSGNRIIGNNNTDSNLDGVFILGNNVTAGLADSVYLGSNSAYVTGSDASSTTAGVNSYSSVTIGSGNYTFAGANAAGVVTVGSVGSERRIQNVSAGLVSSTSTDAVNGSQLYTLTQPLRFAGDNSTVGSSSALDKNVIQRSSDQALKITGGANLNNLSSNNIGVVASTDTNTLTVQLAKDLTGLNSVTTGNTVMNTNGVTIGSGSSAVSLTNDGLSNGNNTITNVKAGVNGTDAVNVSQLNTAAAKATTTVSNGTNTTVSSTTATDGHTNYQVNLNDKITLGSGANAVTVDGTAGAVTAGTKVSLDGVNGRGTVGNVTINGSGTTGTVNGLTNKTWDPNNYVSGQAATEDQLKLAVNTSNTTVTNAGLNFAGNDGTVIHKNLGDQLNIVGGYTGNGTTSSKNIKTVKNQSGNLEIQMADDAVFNSLTTGNTVMNNSGITIGSGSSAVSLTNTGLNNGGQKITNVAAGTADTDGVNVSQLNQSAAAAKTTVSQGKNITITETPEEDGHTDYNVALNDIITLGTGTSAVTIDGIAGTVATGNTTIYGDKIITGATTITDLGLITAGTGDYAVKIDGTAGTISAGTKVSFDGTQGTGTIGKVIINGSGTTGTINGLTNKTWDPNNYTSGQAATEDQLSAATNNLINAGLTFAGNTGSIQKKLGDTMNIVGGYNGSGTTSGNNIKTVVNSNGDMEIQMADDASFNSVTTGNTVMNTNGVTTTDTNGNTTSVTGSGVTTTDTAGHTTSVTAEGVTAADADGNSSALSSTGLTTTDAAGNTTSVTGNGMTITGENGKNVSLTSNGLDNGGNKITNVAAGTADTDAVNVSQLNAAAAAAKTTVSQGKNITVTSVQKDDGHTDYNVALNDTITLGSGTNAVTVDGTTGAVTTGNTAIYGDKIVTGATTITDQGVITAGTGDNAVKIDGTAGTISAGTKVSFDGTQGTGTIGNVTINGNGSTGTVNGLTNKTWEPDNYVSGQAASEDQLKVLDDRTVQYDRNEDGTVNKGQITLAGDGGTKITNVTAGTLSSDSTDAVNGSQLYATNQAVINNSQSINILGNSINKLDNRVNKVGAGAAALAALHPLDFDPDNKWDFAAGFGNYRDATAVAVGAFYRPNEDTMFSVGGNFGNGENMVNAGVSFKLGQGNHVSTSRVAMAKELKDVRAVVAQQAEQIQQLAAMVNSLVGVQAVKPDTTVMFPDVPKNHWAYETIKAMAAQGLIEGYPDGTFGGDRTMTRYEFAQIIYRVIQKGIAVDSKLIGEFKPELERIRVDTITRDKNGNPTIERVRVNK